MSYCSTIPLRPHLCRPACEHDRSEWPGPATATPHPTSRSPPSRPASSGHAFRLGLLVPCAFVVNTWPDVREKGRSSEAMPSSGWLAPYSDGGKMFFDHISRLFKMYECIHRSKWSPECSASIEYGYMKQFFGILPLDVKIGSDTTYYHFNCGPLYITGPALAPVPVRADPCLGPLSPGRLRAGRRRTYLRSAQGVKQRNGTGRPLAVGRRGEDTVSWNANSSWILRRLLSQAERPNQASDSDDVSASRPCHIPNQLLNRSFTGH